MKCVSHSVHVGGSLYNVNSCLAAWSHVPSGMGVSVMVPCSFWKEISMPGPMFLLGVSVQGGFCQGSLSGVSVQGSLSGGVSVKRISVQGCLCPGGCVQGSLSSVISVQGVSVRGYLPDRDLLYDEERAVHILLEYFLVHCCFPIDQSVI